jgi:excinuclease ABC subunit C
MTIEQLKSKRIPDAPGVYFFLGKRKQILYIGKATSLKNRVRSYFDSHVKEKRSLLIEKMVLDAKEVSWTVTDSVLEAMLLEVNLIRTHKPPANTRSRDDKSYNHLVITKDEYPRVLVMRGKDLQEEGEEKYAHVFGPFPSGTLFKEALKIIRKLFQFYDTKAPVDGKVGKIERGKIDFNRQIGLYPDATTKKVYQKTITHICELFSGNKHKIIADLTKDMKQASKEERFEEAKILRDKIRALEHIQDVSLIKNEHRIYKDERSLRIESYDIAHLFGSDMVGVMTVIEGGELAKSEYRKFNIRGFTASNDPGALQEVLTRRLGHPEWPFPDLLIVDGSTAQKNAFERVLKRQGLTIPVVGVVKDERHRPIRLIGQGDLIEKHKNAILLANAEAHRFAITFHRSKRKLKQT